MTAGFPRCWWAHRPKLAATCGSKPAAACVGGAMRSRLLWVDGSVAFISSTFACASVLVFSTARDRLPPEPVRRQAPRPSWSRTELHVGAPRSIANLRKLCSTGQPEPRSPRSRPGCVDWRDVQGRRSGFVPSQREEATCLSRPSSRRTPQRSARSTLTFRTRTWTTSAGASRPRVAREGDRRGSVAGRAARDDPGARALLGDGLRLAQVRGEAERPAAVHHRDRRA